MNRTLIRPLIAGIMITAIAIFSAWWVSGGKNILVFMIVFCIIMLTFMWRLAQREEIEKQENEKERGGFMGLYMWKYLLSVLLLAASWLLLIAGSFLSLLMFFLWFSRTGKIFQAYPQMSFDNFLHITRMGYFWVMLITGFLGIYLLQWRNLSVKKILRRWAIKLI